MFVKLKPCIRCVWGTRPPPKYFLVGQVPPTGPPGSAAPVRYTVPELSKDIRLYAKIRPI